MHRIVSNVHTVFDAAKQRRRWVWVCGGALLLGNSCQVQPRHDSKQEADELQAPVRIQRAPAVNSLAEAAASAQASPAPAAANSSPPTTDGPCPRGMVASRDSCIDRYEAHLMRRTEDGSLVLHPPHARPVGDVEYVAESRAGVLPQAYISRLEAERACDNAGKRLCGAEEWYTACRGEPGTTYPYGAKFERGRCNVGKPHLLSQLYGTNPRLWKYDEHFNNPGLNQLKGFLEPSGKFEGCKSSFGVQDMVGNLHEWVLDRVDRSLPLKIPLADDIRRGVRKHAGKGVFLGGFFSTTSEHGFGCRFATIAHEASYHDYSTGFRCCRDLASAG